MKLEGRVALVTGAGSGIGRAIALALAEQGADVVVTDMNIASARAVAREVRGLKRKALALRVDVTRSRQVEEAVARSLARFRKIDTLVNNVGWDKFGLFHNTDEKFWRRVIDINYVGTLICTKAVLSSMIARKAGVIVNIASDAAKVGSTGESVYAGAKAAVVAFSKTLAREMTRYNIRVNCICPGPTDTPLFHSMMVELGEKVMESIVNSIPMRRLGKPQEIAQAAAFLASDDASFITGQALSVSGGLTMQ